MCFVGYLRANAAVHFRVSTREQLTIRGCQGVSCLWGGGTGGCRSAEPQTVDRRYHGLWELLEELSPAQTEPTNTISVSNTIVRFTRANAIIVSPVPRVHSAHNPWSQTFGPTLGLIFDVDKTHTIALSPMWLDQGGGGGTHCCFSLNRPEQPQ